jgi:hypothetical protein
MKYFDSSGNEQAEDWARIHHGEQDIHRVTLPGYELIELRQRRTPLATDSKELMVNVLDVNGLPAAGVTAVLSPGTVSGNRITADTGANGQVLFDIGDTAYRYAVPNHAPWVIGLKNVNADVYNSVGWVQAPGSPKVWLNPTFKWVGAPAEPPVEPPVEPPIDDDKFQQLMARLDRIIVLLGQ